MPDKKHFALRGGLPLVALAALAFGVPTAGAATFGDGNVNVVPTSSFSKKVRFTPTAPATRSGRGVSFPVETGQSTMSEAPTGNFALTGRLQLRSGNRRVTGTGCEEVLAASVGRLRCRFGNRTVILFQQDIRSGKIQPDSDFAGMTGTAIRTTLTSAAAKFLNSALRLRGSKRVKRNQRVGNSSLDVVRFLEAVGGEQRTAYDPAFYDKLQSCNIRLEPLAPATAFPPADNAPRGGVNLPVGSGTFNARDLRGQANLTGGTRLQRDNPPYTSDLTNFVFDLSTTPPTLSAFASRFNQTLPIGTVEGASVTKNLTADGGSVTVENGRLVISDLAAQVLSSDTGCELGPNERTIGTAGGTITVV